MKSIGAPDKEFSRGGILADADSDRTGQENDWKLAPGRLEAEKKSRQGGNFHSLGARMESISVSLWSWLVVAILSAWFVIWLAETLGHLGTRIP